MLENVYFMLLFSPVPKACSIFEGGSHPTGYSTRSVRLKNILLKTAYNIFKHFTILNVYNILKKSSFRAVHQ